MTTFAIVVLAAIAFIFVAYPFYRGRLRRAGSAEDGRVDELLSKRNTTYSMLKELEFDYKSGILTEKDYHELETKYKKKAINILKDLDSAQASAAVGDDIEEAISNLRRRGDGDGQPQSQEPEAADEIEEAVSDLRRKGASVGKPQSREPEAADEIEEAVSDLRRKGASVSKPQSHKSEAADEIEEAVSDLRRKRAGDGQMVTRVEKHVPEPGQKASYCRNCGVKIREDDVFCYSCGTKLN